jgi:TadE-like protein
MTRSLTRLLLGTREIRGDSRANAAIEFGLAAPILIALGLGAFDYGSAYVEGVRLSGVARAGAQQALYDVDSWQNDELIEQTAHPGRDRRHVRLRHVARFLRLPGRRRARLLRHLPGRIVARQLREGQPQPVRAADAALSMGKLELHAGPRRGRRPGAMREGGFEGANHAHLFALHPDRQISCGRSRSIDAAPRRSRPPSPFPW